MVTFRKATRPCDHRIIMLVDLLAAARAKCLWFLRYRTITCNV